MKRYALFTWPYRSSSGGWESFKGWFDDWRIAVDVAAEEIEATKGKWGSIEWWHVLDTNLWEIVITNRSEL